MFLIIKHHSIFNEFKRYYLFRIFNGIFTVVSLKHHLSLILIKKNNLCKISHDAYLVGSYGF